MKTFFRFRPSRALRQIGLALLLSAGLAATAAAEPLVSVQWLDSHRADPDLVVLDVRSAIDGGGAKAYLDAHIPGSVHSDYDRGGWRVTVHNVPFMLPAILEIQNLIGNLGIDEHSHVVVVPAGVHVTDFGSAARVYWTLKVAGVPNVSILDGGIAAWKQAGLPVEKGAHAPAPKTLFVDPDESQLAKLADVEKIEQSGGATLIDARPASFFNGKEKASKVAAYGRIPGAFNLDNGDFYDSNTNRLKPKAELAAIASQLPAGPLVSYCNTGHWSATEWFVLHELLGRNDVKVYAGSMIEWTADPHRPLESARTKWDDLKKKLGLGS
jgi:thiosulfate/3-mercaptopyruvate sulfurtransferase